MVSLWGLWIRSKMALPMRLKQITAASTATVYLSNWSCFTKYFLNIASVSISLKNYSRSYFSRSRRLKKPPRWGVGRSRRVIPGISVGAVDWRRPRDRELDGRGGRFQACHMRKRGRHAPWLSLRLSLVFRPPSEIFLALPLDVERASGQGLQCL